MTWSKSRSVRGPPGTDQLEGGWAGLQMTPQGSTHGIFPGRQLSGQAPPRNTQESEAAGRGPGRALQGPPGCRKVMGSHAGTAAAPPRPSPARLPLITSPLWLHVHRDLPACSFPSPSGPEPGWLNHMEFQQPSQVVQLPFRHILNLIIVIITFGRVNVCRFIRFFSGPPI